MPKTYADLLSNDPAWPALETELKKAPNGAVVLPPDEKARAGVLERLQVTTRSTLGAVAHETGGILIDHGWLRVLGSGNPRLPRAVGAWNEAVGIALGDGLVVADDAVGGIFAINGGALGDGVGNVFYFAPDSLEWEDTELGHSDWLGWALEGDLATFYETFRWPGWEKDVEALGGDRSLHFWPPPWTEEGEDVSKASRKEIPTVELYSWMLDEAAGDDDEDDEG